MAGETLNHQRAKALIQIAVETDPATVRLIRHCPRCRDTGDQPLLAAINRAALEYRLPTGDRADVALLGRDDDVRVIVEVRETHAVPAAKARRLKVPWLEVSAEDVLTNPYRWTVIREHGLPGWRCRGQRARDEGLVMRVS